ncbi:MAG: hypothetical protein JRN20_12665 [Nitrososphaerota archaeon]|nr:hypothetical protein [Nitrososphaerota archaeon]MDG6923022.1 hypothetical protein [Nitrososphaerota archaeon]
MKYIIAYKTKFGSISIESKKPQDLYDAYSELKRIASKLRSTKAKKGESKTSSRTGKGETTAILREIESNLLSTSFFSSPKTTGETGDQLAKVTRKKFTSRKVSQALGILRKKGVLRRTGKRNFFSYTTA